MVHAAGGAGQARLERAVQVAHRLPIRLEVGHRGEIETGVPLGVRESGDESRQRRLTRGARHGRGRRIHGIRPCRRGSQQGRELTAGGVVRVDMHRHVEPLAQSRHQAGRRRGTQKTRHVLDREDVRTRLDDLLGQTQIVVERVEVFARVEQVAGVADGDLGDGGAGGQDRVDRGTHLRDVVERVEDPEDVDPGCRGLGDERVRHLRRVRGVADGVASAQEHLDGHVRQSLTEHVETLPRVFTEETEGDVVGRPAPRLHGQQLRSEPGHVGGDPREVARAHARREERLVRVAERRLGDGEGGLLAQRPREARGTQLLEALTRAGGSRGGEIDDGELAARLDGERVVAVGAVDRGVDQPRQHLRAAVLRFAAAEQLGPLIDEGRTQVARDERGVVQHRLQERDVRRDAADAELRERATGAGDRSREVASAARELGQHRVEVGADLRPRRGGAAVQAHTGTAGRAVGRDLAGVGTEALRGVLRRDAALQRGTAEADLVLRELEVGERLARGDAHLGLDEIDVRDLLGHGVLDLDARVHLDEHDLARPGSRRLEQELHGAGVLVADRTRERDGVPVQVCAHGVVEVRGWRDLDHLLVTALHRAVPLEEMHRLARGIREDLHLDVTRTLHGLLEEHPRVAERALGLAHGLGQGRSEFAEGLHAAHAAPAAAGHGFGEEREPDLVRLGDERVHVVGGRRRAQHRHSGGDGVLLRRHLVAGHREHVGRRADEGDAVRGGLLGQLGVLRQESVPGVDGIRPALAGDADDLIDVEIGAHRVPALPDLVRLVGFQSVQRRAILVGVDRDGAGSHLVGGAERADGDLSAIGDQDFREHAHPHVNAAELNVLTA